MRKTLLRTWRRARPGGAPCEGMTSRTKTGGEAACNFSARGGAPASPRCADSGAPSLFGGGGGRRLPTQCAHKTARDASTLPLRAFEALPSTFFVCRGSPRDSPSFTGQLADSPPSRPRQQSCDAAAAGDAAGRAACAHEAAAYTPAHPPTERAHAMPTIRSRSFMLTDNLTQNSCTTQPCTTSLPRTMFIPQVKANSPSRSGVSRTVVVSKAARCRPRRKSGKTTCSVHADASSR